MDSDTVSLIAFIIVAVIICVVFAIVIVRAAHGKGCSCGKEKSSCACCQEHCSFRTGKPGCGGKTK